ncbi:MAG: polysaccharide biosynthesis/export family protein, partial [Planctomycetaceae bacterium]
RPATDQCSHDESNGDRSSHDASRARASAHSVSLIRRPSLGGRIVLWVAIILGMGPGGAYLFRVTQAIFAHDAANLSGESASDVADQPAESGTNAEPTWDLTQQAADAWMVVERPAQSDPSAANPQTSSATPDDGPVPVFNLDAVRTPIQLLGGVDGISPEALDALATHTALSPTPVTAEQSAQTPPTSLTPTEDKIAQSREQWPGRDEEYFIKSVPAPLAPPADSEPVPAVTFPQRNAVAGPPQEPLKPALPNRPVESTIDELATQPVFVDVPAANSAPLEGALAGMSSIGAHAAGCNSAACEGGAAPVCGIHCNGECACQDLRWKDSWMIPWEVFAQGEYIGPSRMPHVPEYRLRVDDQIEFVFRLTGEKSAGPYRINTGDNLRIESLTSENLNREVLVQPDGTISLSHLGQVLVAGRTIEEVRSDLEARYAPLVRNPSMTVTPIKVNSVLEELRATVDGRFGNGGQSRIARVTPEGTVQLPAIGSVPAHGLTLSELRAEIQYRYAEIVNGLEVTPILHERAPRYVYVLGEVRAPGRYTLEGPTSLMQAVALAGGWNVGANLTQVVVFRRDDCWRLMATRVGIRRPLYGKDPCPDGEIWLRDSDIVVVPKSPILVVDEFIDLVFTRGVYGVVPFSTNLSYVRNLSGGAASVVPVP